MSNYFSPDYPNSTLFLLKQSNYYDLEYNQLIMKHFNDFEHLNHINWLNDDDEISILNNSQCDKILKFIQQKNKIKRKN
jgi:hypothetical protein